MSFCASASCLAHLFRVLVVLTMLMGLVGTQASPGLGQEASPAPVTTEAPAETPTPGPTEAATSEPAQPTATASAESTETGTATISETPVATATATAEVENSESTGSLVITTVDENGSAVSGACYAVDYVGLYVCDANDGLDDSVTTLANVPAGLELTLRQAQTGAGYAIAEPTLFTLAAGETKNIEIVNPHGATIAINVLDGDGNPAPGAWYYLFKDAGGGALGPRVLEMADSWDGNDDGTVTMSSLLPGSYVIYEYISPQLHVQAANVLITVAAGETKSIDIPHVPYSTVIIHTEDPDHVPLPGARYDAFEPDGPSRGAVGSGCDGCDGGPDDGTTVVRVPAGTWRLEQIFPPKDYLRAPNQEIAVGERETLELTITNEPGAVITVHATDVWGNVVQHLSWSLYVDAGGGAHGALVAGASDDGGNGTTVFPPVPAGDYVIEPAYNSDVYLAAQPVQVTVTLGQHLDVTIPVPEQAPKMTTGPWIADLTQTSAVIQWGTDQLTIGYVDYGLTRNLGRVRPRTAQAPATFHQVTLDSLTADTLYYFRVRGASPNGDVLSGIYLFRTPAATANAALVIKKVNSSSIPLGDSCFEVYKDAGSGRLGAYSGEACDKFDTSPNDGTLRINGLAAGAYVLVETRAPTGYAVAAPVRFSVTSGQTKTITVTNYRGGSTLTVTATTGFPPGTPGACFALYKDAGSGNLGPYVASACDDYDGLDALTTFVGLRAGNYVIWEWIVPNGFVRGENLPISIGTREVRSVDFINLSQTSGQTVRLRTADSTGKLLPGACFIIFPFSGAASRYACDGWDGHVDGQTFFANVEDGQYSAFEVIAPTGYTVGKSTTFTKSFNRQITRTFTQIKGGTTVKVKTLNGGTSTLLKGACYALYKSSTGSLVTFACDGDGALDGYTTFAGVPAGTYFLDQFSTPLGYAQPRDRTITVGTSTITFVVRTYKQ